jgi:CRISPR-associated protein Cmr2
MNEGKTLLLLSLGPVQDFIAAARTCQDLWYGSELLSQLSAKCAETVKEHGAEAVVFPAMSASGEGEGAEDPRQTGVANKILCVLKQGAIPREVAEKARDEVHRALLSEGNKHFDGVKDRDRGLFGRARARQQLSDLIEFFWASVPLGRNYAESHRRVEDLLAGRKNTKTWAPVPWNREPGTPKSSIDGQRESVFSPQIHRQQPPLSAQELWGDYRIKPGEHLCGVGVLKRFGAAPAGKDDFSPARPPFHSSGHMAAASLFPRLARSESARQALAEFLDTLDDLGISDETTIGAGRVAHKYTSPNPRRDGEPVEVPRALANRVGDPHGQDGCVLFASRLAELVELVGPPETREEDLRRAEFARRALIAALGAGAEPYPYFAILHADGDKMGKAISHLAGHDAEAGIAGHQALSGRLADFADGCGALVERCGGSLVYSGGDDVLALLPLHTALRASRALAESFAKHMARVPNLPEGDERPTLSVGLAVVHYLEPMGESLDLARKAEKLAKEKRNSLAVIASKRSGGDLAATATWDQELDTRLLKWAELLTTQKLPDGIAFELEEIAARFERTGPRAASGPEEPDAAAVDRAVLALAKRAITRKYAQQGAAKMADSVINELIEHLENTETGAIATAKVRALAEEIQIARIFAEALDRAWGNVQ